MVYKVDNHTVVLGIHCFKTKPTTMWLSLHHCSQIPTHLAGIKLFYIVLFSWSLSHTCFRMVPLEPLSPWHKLRVIDKALMMRVGHVTWASWSFGEIPKYHWVMIKNINISECFLGHMLILINSLPGWFSISIHISKFRISKEDTEIHSMLS